MYVLRLTFIFLLIIAKNTFIHNNRRHIQWFLVVPFRRHRHDNQEPGICGRPQIKYLGLCSPDYHRYEWEGVIGLVVVTLELGNAKMVYLF